MFHYGLSFRVASSWILLFLPASQSEWSSTCPCAAAGAKVLLLGSLSPSSELSSVGPPAQGAPSSPYSNVPPLSPIWCEKTHSPPQVLLGRRPSLRVSVDQTVNAPHSTHFSALSGNLPCQRELGKGKVPSPPATPSAGCGLCALG